MKRCVVKEQWGYAYLLPCPSRYSHYTKQDACRLPEGFKRIAYDADTARYTFRDREGALWLSKPGESYGKLMPVSPNGKNVESWRYDDDDDDGGEFVCAGRVPHSDANIF